MKDRGLVVELVGPWGAGKSTLVESLTRRDRSVEAFPCVWTLPTPLLFLGGVQVITTMLGVFRTARRILWKESRMLMRLRTVCQQLRLQRLKPGRVVIIDEGPAVMMSWLRELAHRARTDGGAAPWWRRLVTQWAKAVDIVVFLDAPDSVLAERIRTRTQRHPLKDSPDAELSEFIGRTRAAYVGVLSDLRSQHSPTMLEFRTDQHSVAHITERLLEAVARERNGR